MGVLVGFFPEMADCFPQRRDLNSVVYLIVESWRSVVTTPLDNCLQNHTHTSCIQVRLSDIGEKNQRSELPRTSPQPGVLRAIFWLKCWAGRRGPSTTPARAQPLLPPSSPNRRPMAEFGTLTS